MNARLCPRRILRARAEAQVQVPLHEAEREFFGPLEKRPLQRPSVSLLRMMIVMMVVMVVMVVMMMMMKMMMMVVVVVMMRIS